MSLTHKWSVKKGSFTVSNNPLQRTRWKACLREPHTTSALYRLRSQWNQSRTMSPLFWCPVQWRSYGECFWFILICLCIKLVYAIQLIIHVNLYGVCQTWTGPSSSILHSSLLTPARGKRHLILGLAQIVPVYRSCRWSQGWVENKNKWPDKSVFSSYIFVLHFDWTDKVYLVSVESFGFVASLIFNHLWRTVQTLLRVNSKVHSGFLSRLNIIITWTRLQTYTYSASTEQQ